jgi:hypothetical protein
MERTSHFKARQTDGSSSTMVISAFFSLIRVSCRPFASGTHHSDAHELPASLSAQRSKAEGNDRGP